jgi:hypothetical protein
MLKLPKGLTVDMIHDAAFNSSSSVGFCMECGAEHDGKEPDTEKDECEKCGSNSVYGAEQILLII